MVFYRLNFNHVLIFSSSSFQKCHFYFCWCIFSSSLTQKTIFSPTKLSSVLSNFLLLHNFLTPCKHVCLLRFLGYVFFEFLETTQKYFRQLTKNVFCSIAVDFNVFHPPTHFIFLSTN